MLDEPTIGLDPVLRVRIMGSIHGAGAAWHHCWCPATVDEAAFGDLLLRRGAAAGLTRRHTKGNRMHITGERFCPSSDAPPPCPRPGNATALHGHYGADSPAACR